MRIFTILLFAIIFTSCGKLPMGDAIIYKKPSDPRQFTTTNPELVSYGEEFQRRFADERRMSIGISHIPMNFGNTTEGTNTYIGVCYSWSDGRREIIINENWWARASECSKQGVINHELGHCALNRDHKDEEHLGRPLSLMNTYAISGETFCKFEGDYYKELFTYNHSDLVASMDEFYRFVGVQEEEILQEDHDEEDCDNHLH